MTRPVFYRFFKKKKTKSIDSLIVVGPSVITSLKVGDFFFFLVLTISFHVVELNDTYTVSCDTFHSTNGGQM